MSSMKTLVKHCNLIPVVEDDDLISGLTKFSSRLLSACQLTTPKSDEMNKRIIDYVTFLLSDLIKVNFLKS